MNTLLTAGYSNLAGYSILLYMNKYPAESLIFQPGIIFAHNVSVNFQLPVRRIFQPGRIFAHNISVNFKLPVNRILAYDRVSIEYPTSCWLDISIWQDFENFE